MSLKNRLLSSLAAPAAIAAMLGVSAVGMMAMSPPAYAQSVLDSMQVASLRSSLMASIRAAKGDQAAMTAAISQAMTNALAQYGYDAAGSITSAIIMAAEQAGAPAVTIGNGLAQAAASVTPVNATAAQAIARTVANEGRMAEVAAFQTTSLSLGQTQLASIAGAGAAPTAEVAGGGLTAGGGANALAGGFTGGGAGGGGGGTCLNPSCTK